MITAWIVGTVLLLMVIFGAAFIALAEGSIDLSERDERYIFFGVGTVTVVAALFWPLTLALAIPVAICYGIYSLAKLVGMYRKGEFSD